jgi:hypothetical protein
MCIGNTTSPAASNTNYINWRDDQWETPQVIPTSPTVSDPDRPVTQKKSSLKAKSKSQSSKTSGGTY